MTQHMTVAKPDTLSPMPKTYVVGGENEPAEVVFWLTHTHKTCAHTHTINK